MIILTKLNDEPFTLNIDLVEYIFESPDTTIRLLNGNLYIVKESMQEIIDKTVYYKRQINTKFADGTFIEDKMSRPKN